MSRYEIIATVKSFLESYTSDELMDFDQPIFSSGLVNSLFSMQLVMFLEKNFSISIDGDDLDMANFQTLNAIADFVFNKKSNK